jgi:hypothetical protein
LAFIIAIAKGWKILQFDVKNAFIHTLIDIEIYMQLPTGYYQDNKYKNKVYRLKKAIYGLKQSPRLWYKYLSTKLKELGYVVFNYDPGAFINKDTNSIILCHVDDLLIMGPNPELINNQIVGFQR